jgi:nicotinamide mononucleotide adenylyltransferase
LFQCSGNQEKTEGEAFLYPTGGVGIFGEIGSPDASLRPNQWNRVVVTMGSDQTSKPQRNQFQNSLDGIGEEEKFSFSSFPSDLQPGTKNRVLTSYINSKKCTSVSSVNRGVLASLDGRFAVNTKVNFLLSIQHHHHLYFSFFRRELLSLGAIISSR